MGHNQHPEKSREPKWEIIHEEEFPDTAGQNIIGVIQDRTNPGKILFFHVYADEEGDIETCHIYSSVSLDPATRLCEYPWTAENDEALLEALNKCGDNYIGDDSPLKALSFASHA